MLLRSKIQVNLRFFTLAIGVAFAHFLSGIILFADPSSLHTTPLALLSALPGSTPFFDGFTLVIASVLAIMAFVGNLKPWQTLLMILPQQGLLLLSLLSVMIAVISGHYPDGYAPVGGNLFIVADQIWLLTICFWHTIEYGAIFTEEGPKKHEL